MTFFLFLTVLLVGFADQSLISPLLNPLLRDFFGNTSNIVPLGWVTFVFTLFTAASTLASGILADRGSRKKLVQAGCLLFSLASFLSFLIPTGQAGYFVFFLGRALNGLGLGAILPPVFSMVADTVSPGRRATAFGFVSMAMLVGRMAGFLTAGALESNWRLAYSLVGATGLLLSLGLSLMKEPHRGSQEEELRGAVQAGAQYLFRIRKEDIRYLWAGRSNAWLILNFIDVIPGSILIFLIFKFMKDVHTMEAGPVNFIVLLVMVFGALGALIFGRLGDLGFRRDKRARVVVALFCNAVPIFFLVFFIIADFRVPAGSTLGQTLAIPGVWMVIISVVGAMFINQGVNPNWYSTLADVNLPEHRATMVSLASLLDMLGNALGPLLAGYIALLGGLRAALWLALAVWGVNIFLWLPVLGNVRKDLDRRHRILMERAAEMKVQSLSYPVNHGEGWHGGGAGLSGDATYLPPDCPGGKEGLIINEKEGRRLRHGRPRAALRARPGGSRDRTPPLSNSRLAILLNPSAGGGRAGRSRELLEGHLRERGLFFDLIVTESKEQLKAQSRKLAAEGRAIVGAGGDSTFHLIVNEIMKVGGRAPFGMLGLGSSNDITREFGLEPLERAVAALKRGRTRAVDLGCLKQGDNVLRYFLGQANMGLGVEVNRYVDDLARRRPWLARRQTLAGTLGIMRAYRKRRVPLELTIQSTEGTIKGSFIVAVFSNTRYWATGKLIAPQARPDDGRLDACLIEKCSFLRLARINSLAKRGWQAKKRTAPSGDCPQPDRPACIRGVKFLQSAEFTVTSPAGFNIQADGEILPFDSASAVRIQVEPGALRLIC